MSSQGLTILVVDDDEVLREQVQRYLAKSPLAFVTEEVDSKTAGKERILQGGIDCVVVDFHMRDGDAFEMLMEIRAEKPDYDTPMVLLTGVGNEEIAVKAMKLGICDYISKDKLDPKNLENAIRTAVAEQKLSRAESEHQLALEYLSMHDELTGLPNRRLLMERLDQRILISERNGEAFSLLMIDLDMFKSINDSLGHLVGDDVLKIIGSRLQRIARRSDTYARLGGDEFSVLLSSADSVDGAVTVANKISEAVKEPMTINGHVVKTDASIGIAMYPFHGQTAKELLLRADEAMYESKRSINHFTVHVGSEYGPMHENAQIAVEIPILADIEQFNLVYQPKYDLASGEIVGAESLARWWHDVLGDIDPAKFIPIVERSKFVSKFTENVLDKALSQSARWKAEGLLLPISINVSPQALTDNQFTARVWEKLQHYDIAPEMLTLEITETTNLYSYERSAKMLFELAEHGIGISIDDFGTGYTSIRYLREFPVTELKIDRLFVSDVILGSRDYSIIAGIVRLAHGIGARTVAEGIEDAETLQILTDLGCDFGQGFYLGHPTAAANYTSDCRDELFAFPHANKKSARTSAQGINAQQSGSQLAIASRGT